MDLLAVSTRLYVPWDKQKSKIEKKIPCYFLSNELQ